MDIVIPILFFAGFVGMFGWIIVSQTRAQRARDAELDALAAARGWTVTRGTEGRRRIAEIAPQGREWRLKLASGYATGGQRNRQSSPGYAEFRAAEPAWPGGRAVFAQRLPSAMLGRMGGAGLVGFFQNAALRTLLGKLVDPDTLRDLDRLKPFDPPPGIELMILATEDPRGGNLRAIHEAVHGWRPVVARDRGAPAVMIGAEGTAIRVPTELRAVPDIEALVALGERLSGALR